MSRQSREVYITGNVAVDRILNKIGERMDILEGIRPDLDDGYLYIQDKNIISSTAPQETTGILGTVKQITVTDNGDGTVTLSTPQAIDVSADVEFDTVKLGDATASRLMSTDANKKIVSIASLSNWIAGTASQIEVSNDGDGSITLSIPGSFLTDAFLGTANQITVTDNGDGTVTVSTPQDIDTGADVEFNSLTIGDGTTNYTEIKDDGEINLHGTARVYKNEWINPQGLKAPGTKPALAVDWGIGGAWEFSNATDDTIVATVRLPQDMDRTVAMELKIGFASATNTGDVVWQLEYLFLTPNEDTTASAQETLETTQTISTTANGLTIATITGIDLPSSTDQLMRLRIKRLGADGDDTLADDCVLLGCGLRYVADKLGVGL